jgi:hypothetical protein
VEFAEKIVELISTCNENFVNLDRRIVGLFGDGGDGDGVMEEDGGRQAGLGRSKEEMLK